MKPVLVPKIAVVEDEGEVVEDEGAEPSPPDPGALPTADQLEAVEDPE